MFYLLSTLDNMIMNRKEKILIFDTPERATAFAQGFMEYSIARMSREDFMRVPEVMRYCSSFEIVQFTSDFDENTMELIDF